MPSMNDWPNSSLRERLGLAHAIVQAPMAMVSHADLVVAVSNAGGLGSLGPAVLEPATVREQVAAVRARTQQAFALNFFVYPAPVLDSARAAVLEARLAPHRQALGVTDAPSTTYLKAFDDAMLETVLALKPAAVSFHFGAPPSAAIAACKAAGIYLMGTATTVAEALALERAGFDAIVAQGVEAGGHRGTFDEPYARGEIGLFALVPQIVDAVKLPVIAAGGIADGRGIAAALMLGAVGVQIGTAFLTTPEATVHPAYRAVLQTPRARETRLTRLYTGRPARGIVTQFMEDLADQEQATLQYPIQRNYTGPLGKAGLAQGQIEFHSLWAGQSAALARPLTAAALIETLVSETRRVLSVVSGRT